METSAPPPTYIGRVLQVVCAQLGYACGVVVEGVSNGIGGILAAEGVGDAERPLVSCLPGRLAQAHHPDVPVITPHPTTDPALGELFAFCAKRHIDLAVLVPIRYGEAFLGGCYLFATQVREVPPEERQLLQQISEMIAVSMTSRHLLQQLQQRTQELQHEASERARTEQALRDALRNREVLEEIVTHSPVIAFLWRIAPHWSIEYVSPNIAGFGYPREALYAGEVTFYQLVHPQDVKRVSQELMHHLDDGEPSFHLEYRMLTAGGEVRWVEQRFWVRCGVGDDDPGSGAMPAHRGVTHLQGILHDISERKRAEERIRHQAYHDTLTDLPNRALFQDRLTHALAHARRYRKMLAVLFLDLDRFKIINDSLGHAAGDQLLRGVAARLRQSLREEDTIARLGGDEFTVLLPEINDPDDAANVALKIIAALRAPFPYGEHALYVTTSVGISVFPRDGQEAEALLQNADTALYHAKERGRDAFQFYSPVMYSRTLERLALQNQLRAALEQDQFRIYYQPQVELYGGQLIGMEAQLCWQHPERGLLHGEQFLAVAEDSGLSLPLSDWGLRRACRQHRAWQQAGYPELRMAVNITGRLFKQEALGDLLAAVLDDTGLPPHLLELEIGESAAMQDVDYSIGMMHRLKALGVSLTLDHFGTGYSSLIYLKKFPITTLKIDRSIVQGLQKDPQDESIVQAIVTLARRLQLRVMADGVESEGQQDFLRDCQCDGMQGTLFSKPLPGEAFEQLLRFLIL